MKNHLPVLLTFTGCLPAVAMDEIEAVKFWSWFQENQIRIENYDGRNEKFLDLILAKVKEVDSGFFFEMSVNKEDKEFIITAGGNQEVFQAVDSFVAMAPKVENWTFYALKPKTGIPKTSRYQNVTITLSEVWFIPLSHKEKPDFLGLRFGIPNLNPDQADDTKNSLWTVMDSALGEREASLRIQHLEVVPLPSDPIDQGYMKVEDLPDYIEWRKNRSKAEQDGVANSDSAPVVPPSAPSE